LLSASGLVTHRGTQILDHALAHYWPCRHPTGSIEPHLPTIARDVPTDAHRAYEIQHNGFRFICRRDGNRVHVFFRRGHDWTDRVPRIVEALTALRVKAVTLDGEDVVCGPDGESHFELLRAAVRRTGFARCISVRLRLAGRISVASPGNSAVIAW
jgi:ATP-dependent DNA ligase